MNRHPIDSTALIFGLLFALAGMAILIDETAEVDATLVTGAVVGALGVAFIATLVTRQVRLSPDRVSGPVDTPEDSPSEGEPETEVEPVPSTQD